MKTKGKLIKRITVIFLSALIAACLAAMFKPGFGTALAEEAEDETPDKGTVIGLDTSTISSPKAVGANAPWTGNYVWFGKAVNQDATIPVRYRILAPVTTRYGGQTMFVDCDMIITEKEFYRQAPDEGSGYTTNDWAHSYLKEYLNTVFLLSSNRHTLAERNAIATSVLSGHELSEGSTYYEVSSKSVSDYRNYIALTGEKIFVLDVEDISNPMYGYRQEETVKSREKASFSGNSNHYWLRNACYVEGPTTKNPIACCYGDTLEYTSSYNYAYGGVSPAFNIDLNSVILVSRSSDNSSNYGNEYKLTLKDENITISLTQGTAPYLNANGVNVLYTVSGTNASNVTQISVLILDKEYTPGNENSANILYYNPLTLSNTSGITKGLGSFRLPSSLSLADWGQTYHVYILAEDINSLQESDYSSVPLEITLSDEPVVTLDPNGGTFSDISDLMLQGSSVVIPNIYPTKAGYWFCGWSPLANASFGTLQTGSSYSVSENATLYAIWKELDYTGNTLSIESEGTASFNDTTVNVPYTLSGSDANRVSRLSMWILDKQFTTNNTNNARLLYSQTFNISDVSGTLSFTLPSSYPNSYWGDTFQIYLSAIGSAGNPVSNMTILLPPWACTLSFDLNGGTSGAPADLFGITVTIPKSSPVRDGYWFLGWATTADATTATCKSGSEFTLLRDTVLYAVWKQKPVTNCKLTFNLNGGTGTTPATITATYDTAVTVPKASVSRSGYYFMGWSTSKTATTATYKSGSVITLTKDITLYAVWKAASVTKYTLSFDRNGGSGNAPAKITAASGTTVTIPKCSISREGYYFMGWSTTRGGAVAYKSNDTLKLTKDTVLYAVWKAKNVTLQFNVNGGTGTTPAKVTTTYGSTVTVQKSSVSRSGYWFLGWSTSKTATTATYKTGSTLTLKNNVTLYAVWKKQ